MEIPNMNSVCRLCLGDSVYLSVLDDNYVSLPQKILACVDVEVRESDKLPKMICKQCYTKIEEWHDFKKSCEQSQLKLQTWVQETPSFMNVTIKQEEDDEDVMEITECDEMVNIKIEPDCYIDQDIDYLEAPQLSPQFPVQPDVSEPLLVPSSECPVSSHGIEAPPERCRVCNKMFSTVHNRLRHERDLHHLTVDSPMISNSDVDSYSDASSDATQMTTMTRYSLPAKLRAPPSRPQTPVPRTEKEFIEYFLSVSHMVKTRTCTCCRNRYDTNKKLFQHLRKRMTLELFTCYQCWISFPNLSQLRRHCGNKAECRSRAQLLSSENLNFKPYQNYKCMFCMFIFASENAIKLHMEVTHNTVELPISCPTCSCIIDMEEDYREHLYSSCIYRIHCGICKEHFPTSVEFDSHCSVHSSENTETPSEETNPPQIVLNPASMTTQKTHHNCHLCKNKYSNSLSLLKHLRLYHNDPSVHICKICPDNSTSRFMLRSNLADHMLTCHKETSVIGLKDDNNFSCNTCGSLFSNLSDWREHQKQHSNFQCSECREIFETASELENHKSVHSNNLKLKLYRCSESNLYTTAQSSSTNNFVNQLMCRICDKYFTTKKELHDHLALHETMPRLQSSDDEEEGPYSCNLCNKTYKFRFSLAKHNKNVHGEAGTQFRARSRSQPPEVRYTSTSDSTYTNDNQRQCPICDFVCSTSSALYRHNSKYHTNKKKENMPVLKVEQEDEYEPKPKKEFPCAVCSAIFTTAVGLSNHVRRHERQEYEEDIKPKIMRRLSRDSMMSVDEQKPNVTTEYMCRVCQKPFPDIESVQQHLMEHITPDMIPEGAKKIYPCIYCEKICVTAPSLINHMKIHDIVAMKKARRKCPSCGKILANNAALANHLKANGCNKYSKKKKYGVHICKICNKKFSSAPAMYGHMKFHAVRHVKDVEAEDDSKKKTDIPPLILKRDPEPALIRKSDIRKSIGIEFICTDCNMEFPNAESLQKHSRTHVKEPQKVENNASTFRLKNGKKLPMDPSGLQFHCTICDEYFVSAHSYISHKGWHKRIGSKQNLMAQSITQTKLGCTYCKETFDTEAEYEKHQRRHGLKYNCQHCGKEYAFTGHLKRHLHLVHGEMDPDDQPAIEMDTQSEKYVIRKEKPQKVEKRKSSVVQRNYKCTECNTFFPDAKRLRFHVLSHANTTL